MKAIRGHISFVSREPINKKPEVFTIQGYTGTAPSGKRVLFDWFEMIANIWIDPNGYLCIQAKLRDFDWQHAIDGSEPDSGLKDLTTKKLSALTLTEVNYECYADANEEEPISLDLIEFIVEDPYDPDDLHEFRKIFEFNQLQREEEAK